MITKTRLIELRDQLGWMNPSKESMADLISAVMECLEEIDRLGNYVINLRDEVHRMQNPLQ